MFLHLARVVLATGRLVLGPRRCWINNYWISKPGNTIWIWYVRNATPNEGESAFFLSKLGGRFAIPQQLSIDNLTRWPVTYVETKECSSNPRHWTLWFYSPGKTKNKQQPQEPKKTNRTPNQTNKKKSKRLVYTQSMVHLILRLICPSPAPRLRSPTLKAMWKTLVNARC